MHWIEGPGGVPRMVRIRKGSQKERKKEEIERCPYTRSDTKAPSMS